MAQAAPAQVTTQPTFDFGTDFRTPLISIGYDDRVMDTKCKIAMADMPPYVPRQPGEHWRTKAIASVQILAQEVPWWGKAIKTTEVHQVIAVFRNHSRLYRSYEYRPGLRHDRAVRILGRY